MSARLSHLFVHVVDLDVTIRFWTDLIGLELLMNEPGYARVGGGNGFELGLEERSPEQIGSSGIEIAIEVEDVHTTYERLRAAGVTFTGPPAMQPWGATHAWFTDPSGYRCSVYSRPG